MGETETEALARELHEELGVTLVRARRLLLVGRDPGSDFEIRFREVEIRGQPRSLEHDELRWCRRDEGLALPMAPVDRRFLESLGDVDAWRFDH